MTAKNKSTDTRLSYSSSGLVMGCEQKYVHYKVNQIAKDSDASDSTEAFDIGKAFHEVLENTLHTNTDISKNVVEVCKKYNVKHKMALIEAMVFEYLLVHEYSRLQIAVCEIEVANEKTIGYVDAVMKDFLGNWWIVDLKTSGRWDPTLLARLPKDPQLNLYSHFAPKMAAALDLSMDKFMGCRYRVTTKTTIKQKDKESYEAYVRRLRKSVKSYDIVIPKSVMDIKENYDRFSSLHKRSMELRKGDKPIRNMGYCLSYFRPCDYWSQCHGQTYTESQDKVQLYDHSMMATQRNLLDGIL